MKIKMDSAASRSYLKPTGKEELWEFLSFTLWCIHGRGYPNEDTFWNEANRILFRSDCNGTR